MEKRNIIYVAFSCILLFSKSDAEAELEKQVNLPSYGSSGTNYAGYNQSCALESEQGLRCIPNKNFMCDMRVCKCMRNANDPEVTYTYSSDYDKCNKISKREENFSCEVNEQCQASKLGKFSQCSKSNNICECFDVDGKDGSRREVKRYEDVCYVQKLIGSQCSNDLECSVTIPGTVCSGLKATSVGICECAGTNFHYPPQKKCMEIKGINETCEIDLQCNHLSSLDRLSFCNPSSFKCECKDTENGGKFKVEFYKPTKKCFHSRAENETCAYREECYLGYHKKSDCLPHPAYNDQKICQCPVNEKCSATRVLAGLAMLFPIILALFKKLYYVQ